jgi:non-specific serine/threonine protein kinase
MAMFAGVFRTDQHRQAWAVSTELPANFFPAAPVPLVPRSDRDSAARLPTALNSLIGREQEVATVSALLCDPFVRLVTLTGPGGVGKTRLALQVATELADSPALDPGQAFTDGIVFIDLAAIRDAALVVPAIAQTLGLRADGRHPTTAIVTSYLRAQELLLVLDNFEQVVEASPRVTDLLQACSHLTVLVTSRARLHVSGERAVAVPPLSLPSQDLDGPQCVRSAAHLLDSSAAVRLFVDRACAVEPDFALTDANADAVAAIVQRLDGLPLAIELAAARTAIFAPAELLGRLERRLPLLTSGLQDQPARLQTMRTAIAWSYDLLAAEEQQVFRCLATFVGGCTLDAAEAVCGGQEEHAPPPSTPDARPLTLSSVIDVVESLTGQSLVQAIKPLDKRSGAGTTRLVMLETVREFAAEQLAAGGDQTPGRRHAAYYLALATRAERTFWGETPGDWRALILPESENLGAALVWAITHEETETALRLAGTMFEPHWLTGVNPRELGQWVHRALALPGGSAAARIKALISAVWVARAREDPVMEYSLAEEALALARLHEDAFGRASASALLGLIRLHSGDVAGARPHLLAALAGFRELNAGGRIGWTLCHLATLDSRDAVDEGGDTDALARALGCYEEALALFRAIGQTRGIARALHGIAYLTYKQRDLPRALASARDLLALEWRERWPVTDYLEDIADIAGRLGRPDVAVRLYGAADAQRERIGQEIGPLFQAEYDRDVAVSRQALGEAAFAAGWADGRALPLEQAVAQALAPFERARELDERPAELTQREYDVLRLLVAGHTDREIADALYIGRRTAEGHVARILEKLEVHTRAAAVTVAFASGLIDLPSSPVDGPHDSL